MKVTGSLKLCQADLDALVVIVGSIRPAVCNLPADFTAVSSLFFELSLCLSQACLGKMIIFTFKKGQKLCVSCVGIYVFNLEGGLSHGAASRISWISARSTSFRSSTCRFHSTPVTQLLLVRTLLYCCYCILACAIREKGRGRGGGGAVAVVAGRTDVACVRLDLLWCLATNESDRNLWTAQHLWKIAFLI
eukprot:COSAG06_NODE_4505_length_4195_cov_72.292969_5_plen_191_part_00